jgi:methionyl-tRNA formyltransferase
MNRYIIVAVTDYFKKKIKKKNFYFINQKKKLNLKNIERINPKIIFFPHWNWKIKNSILNRYLCIGFHATPLPYGRGGSPIQNMIVRGRKVSTVCAIKLESKLDSGPIYLKKNFKLNGRAEIIFEKIYKIIFSMIVILIKKLPKPKKQLGKIYYFNRRKPEESNIGNLKSLNKVYDHIRMLDTNFKGFPLAFVSTSNLIIKFKYAKKDKNFVVAQAIIEKKIK